MARPAGGRYVLEDGTVVPSVTTVLSRFKNAGPLMWWAHQEGLAGRDYKQTRDNAANIGTVAHGMVEASWRGREFCAEGIPADVLAKATKAFWAYNEWATQTKLRVVEGERPLVSERYKYGGTPDAIMVNEKLAMGDWKTSGGVYGDYLIQLAAYGQLWNENHPELPITGGYHLLRFDKQYGDFEHRYFEQLEDAWEAFKLMIPLNNLLKQLDKRVR